MARVTAAAFTVRVTVSTYRIVLYLILLYDEQRCGTVTVISDAATFVKY